MFAGGKRLMVKREMWTVSQAWEAPGDVYLHCQLQDITTCI